MDDAEPEWVRQNRAIREEMGLAEYRPPRFADGTPTHAVVEGIERDLGCCVRFYAFNPTYPDDWTVEVDGEDAFAIGRRRDKDGNTVYWMTAETFETRVREHLGR